MSLVTFLSLHLNRTSSVLHELKDILFPFSNSAIDFRSWLIFQFMSFKELLVYSIFVSSAKWWIFEKLNMPFRSLIRSEIEVDQVLNLWHSVIYWKHIWAFFCLFQQIGFIFLNNFEKDELANLWFHSVQV